MESRYGQALEAGSFTFVDGSTDELIRADRSTFAATKSGKKPLIEISYTQSTGRGIEGNDQFELTK
ncbi:MAG: hypothetical protein ACI9XJ_000702 [Marivirga sp.]|jgi:hypothetical protein